MTTLRLLTERITLRLNSGEFPIDRIVNDAEIQHAIIGGCSRQLKLTAFDVNYNFDGVSIPAGAMIATYPGLPVVSGDASYSRIMLPAQPMELPERVGVFAVYPSGKSQQAFMYIPPGMINMWRGYKLVNSLNKIMFTAESKWVDVYYDLIGANIPTVDMKLCVVDINLLGDYDPLPISADMESAVITEVLALYGVSINMGKEATTA